MVEIINERKQDDQKARLVEAEMATKYTVMGLAITSQSKQGTKWLKQYVQKMNFVKSLFPDAPEPEEKELPNTSQVMAAFGTGPDGLVGKRSE